jgi:hypothetical protein
MSTRKRRKSKTIEDKTCPECGVVKRYTICVRCGWMSDEDKKKDEAFWEQYNSEKK